MLHGPFHRRESTTQTSVDAVEQCRTGEIWGLIARGGMWPSVKAYAGTLRNRDRGINFTTDTSPAPNGVLDRNSPFDVRWYLGETPGVEQRQKNGEDYACILAEVENCQP